MATRVRWLGHACLSIETGGSRILIDPFLTHNPAAAAEAGKIEADYILVSHGHGDHVGDTIAIAKRTGAMVVSNFEIIGWCEKHGVTNTHAMNLGGAKDFPFGRVKLTLAHHTSVLPDGTYGGNPSGFHLFLNDGPRIYAACDTALFGDMRLIGEEGVDLAILPIGDNYTMGPDDSLRALALLRAQRVLPIHYNTWPVIAQDVESWASKVRAQALAEPVVLSPGGVVEL